MNPNEPLPDSAGSQQSAPSQLSENLTEGVAQQPAISPVSQPTTVSLTNDDEGALNGGILERFRKFFRFKTRKTRKSKNKSPEPNNMPRSLQFAYDSFRRGEILPFDISAVETAIAREEEANARTIYGRGLIFGYLFLIVLLAIFPLLLWAGIIFLASEKSEDFTKGLRDLQDFTLAIMGALSGVSGWAGFVVGRYFQGDKSGSK